MNVRLTEYPYFPGTMMEPDQALLDRLAADDVTRRDGDTPAMTEFLFGAVPVRLFDEIFASDDPTALPVGPYLWLFHLSGYYGGLWLREELVKSGHNTMIERVSLPPDEAQFRAMVDGAKAILAAAAGPDVLAYNERSLFDQPDPANPAQQVPGLVDSFGYNQGYLLQIAEASPEGLSSPPDLVSCPATAAEGPLYCEYGTNQLTVLRSFDAVAERLRVGEGAYGELAARIAAVQEPAIARGRMVWDGQLNVQGFAQDAYDQLIDISAAFLETVQATALATVDAVVTRNELVGRRAATANAMMAVWLRSYIVGLTDGRPVGLPTFEA